MNRCLQTQTAAEIRRFTMIELTAAMAVMTLVAGIIAFSGSVFYNAWQRTARSSEKLHTYMAVDRIMDSRVRMLVRFRWKYDDYSGILFDGKPDSMFFTCITRYSPGSPSAFLFIRLRCEDGKLLADYSPYPRVQWADADDEKNNFPSTEVIAENVKSISFLYANEEDSEIQWYDRWKEYGPDAVGKETAETADVTYLPVPLAVQLKIEFTDGTSECWLRRTAGNSKNTAYEQ